MLDFMAFLTFTPLSCCAIKDRERFLQISAFRKDYKKFAPFFKRLPRDRRCARLHIVSLQSQQIASTSCWAEVFREASSWESLESEIKKILGPKLYTFRLGETLRKEECRVVLFADENLWCPYTKRVYFQLEEKGIPYRLWYLDMFRLAPWYKDLNPSCQVPTAIIDGVVVYDSAVIMRYIEDKFTFTKPLMPMDMEMKMREDLYDFERLERRISNTWMLWFTEFYTEKERLEAFYITLDQVEEALKLYSGPFFLGEEFSLVDILFAPFMDAIAASALYYKGIPVKNTGGLFPAIERWFEALSQRPAYQNTRSDEMTIIKALPHQFEHANILPGAQKVATFMTEKAKNLSVDDVKDDMLEQQGRLEASAKIIMERDNLFSVLEKTSRTFKGIENHSIIDGMLRFCAKILLEGNSALPELPREPIPLIYNAIQVLRDYIRVPRDLRYPAARQFQAYMNWIGQHTCPRSLTLVK